MTDGGEAEKVFDKGAFATVISQAHWATVKEAVAMARKKGESHGLRA
jgi:3-keto-L-gulonate-6-phosphate decarboxylase